MSARFEIRRGTEASFVGTEREKGKRGGAFSISHSLEEQVRGKGREGGGGVKQPPLPKVPSLGTGDCVWYVHV